VAALILEAVSPGWLRFESIRGDRLAARLADAVRSLREPLHRPIDVSEVRVDPFAVRRASRALRIPARALQEITSQFFEACANQLFVHITLVPARPPPVNLSDRGRRP
jgi:hypothetical protein